MECLPDQRPAHGAPRQREAALLVPGQAPAEAPQLPGQHQQQERGQHRGERGGQGRQHPKLRQREHLRQAGLLSGIHLCPCVKAPLSRGQSLGFFFSPVKYNKQNQSAFAVGDKKQRGE